MRRKISCLDKYEASKLASLIYIKEGKETFITEILNIVDNEIVIMLKDKSAHSILFKNSTEVESFADFIQSILEKEHKIVNIETFEDMVEIIKD